MCHGIGLDPQGLFCHCRFPEASGISHSPTLPHMFMNGKLQIIPATPVQAWRVWSSVSASLSDPLRALELQPYSLKPLLRRAMAYESLERYKKAYVDYKTVLQMDTGVQAAHDSVHRSAQLSLTVNHPRVAYVTLWKKRSYLHVAVSEFIQKGKLCFFPQHIIMSHPVLACTAFSFILVN